MILLVSLLVTPVALATIATRHATVLSMVLLLFLFQILPLVIIVVLTL